MEYLDLFQKNITISTNTFGTSFFTLTSFHGLHVFVGLIGMLIITGLALIGGKFKRPKSKALNSISLYWHFVDLVWVIIFTTVYLLA